MRTAFNAFTAFTTALTARTVEAACAAPSIHNSQPWQFEADGDELILRGVPDRALSVADPHARALYISCGAALLNVRVALRACGLDPQVRLLPHPEYPFDVLAVIRATPGQPATAGERNLFQSIWRRHTDRGPYSARPVPSMVMAGLRKSAAAEDATLRQLDRGDTAAVLRLAARAGQELARDAGHRGELRRWLNSGGDDGIPDWALPAPPQRLPSPVRDGDFLAVAPAGPAGLRARAAYERCAQLAVLTTEHDEPEDWLMAGQALQRVLLVATLNMLSASFLFHVIERDDLRDAAERSWPWPENPQMIIRLGYGAGAMPTPRRSADSVMHSAAPAFSLPAARPGTGLRAR